MVRDHSRSQNPSCPLAWAHDTRGSGDLTIKLKTEVKMFDAARGARTKKKTSREAIN